MQRSLKVRRRVDLRFPLRINQVVIEACLTAVSQHLLVDKETSRGSSTWLGKNPISRIRRDLWNSGSIDEFWRGDVESGRIYERAWPQPIRSDALFAKLLRRTKCNQAGLLCPHPGRLYRCIERAAPSICSWRLR